MNPADAATLAFARWLVYACAVLVIGHVGAEVVARRAGLQGPATRDRIGGLKPADYASRWAIALLAATVALLGAQAFSWFGTDALSDLERLESMIRNTVWGRHWMFAATSAVVVLALSLALRHVNAGRGALLLAIATLVTVSAPLTGHGGNFGTFNRTMHALHLAGAGFWIGTLAVLVTTVWPKLRTTANEPDGLTALLRALSPIALCAAGVLVLSGVALSVVNVVSVDALFASAYGQTLLVKVAAVVAVVAIGFMNWRSHANRAPDAAVLRRRALAEVVLGLVVVLAITAWLGGLEIPAELVVIG